MTQEIREALQTIQLFRDLTAPQLDVVAEFSAIRTVRAGETIFCQGEPSPFCFGVVSGEVVIELASKDRRFPPKILGVLGPGSLFGESAFFEDSPRLAMASTTKPGELVTIKAPRLRDWVKAEPAAGLALTMGILRASIERLHHTSQELSTLYGVGRLLGSAKPFAERLTSAIEFLRGSLTAIDGIILYRRSAHWEEFEPLTLLPPTGEAVAISATHPLVMAAASATGALALESPAEREALEALRLPWAPPTSAMLVPLSNRDAEGHPVQGFLLLTSHTQALYSPEIRLLLSAIANPFAEALSRHDREEDKQAQSRLQRSRQDYHP